MDVPQPRTRIVRCHVPAHRRSSPTSTNRTGSVGNCDNRVQTFSLTTSMLLRALVPIQLDS